VIIPDLNLLLYAYDAASTNQAAAAAWWEGCINGGQPVGLPHVVLFGFLRLATSARVFVSPMSVEESVDCVRAWLARPHVVEAEGGPEHVASVLDLLQRVGGGGNLSTDAQIAAVALHHGATLYTNDSDFRRFPGLRTKNPLAA
jgi:uncharacterized protein